MSQLFANPWGLVALAALPAVLALHLFWQRFRPHRMAGLFLWTEERRQIIAGRTRDRLHRTASLVLELLAALLLALAAAELSPIGAARGEHVVIVVDGSASMWARAPGGGRFVELAAARADALLARLGAADRATVIVSGPSPAVVAGPRERPDAARAVVARLAGRDVAEADCLDRAVALALEIASADGAVHVYSDARRDAERVPAGVAYTSVGEPLPNVALVAADRSIGREEQTKERIFVAVRNLSPVRVACEVVFEREGTDASRVPVDVEGGATSPVAIGAVRSDRPARVRLLAPAAANALDVDDEVTLLPERFPTVLYENRLRGAAGRLVERAVACARGVAPASEVGGVPGIVFCGGTEAVPPGAWRVVVAAPAAGSPVTRLAGPYVIARSRLEAEDVSLAGVLWTADARQASLGEGARPLVACGDRVLAWWSGDDVRTYVFDIDLERSGLAASPAWPVLVNNVIEQRRARLPGVERRNVALGDVVRVQLPDAPDVYDLVLGGVRARLPGAGSVRALTARPVGGYAVVASSGATFDEFRANVLAPNESDLRALGACEIGTAAPVAGARDASDRYRWPAALAAALALAAFVGDWYVLRRSAGRASGGGA